MIPLKGTQRQRQKNPFKAARRLHQTTMLRIPW
jgi:hypothetical protein